MLSRDVFLNFKGLRRTLCKQLVEEAGVARQIRRQVKGSSRAGVGECVRAGGLRGWERAPATTPTLNANVSASLAHPAPRSYRQMPGLRYYLFSPTQTPNE